MSNNNLTVLEWTYKLQYLLDKMTPDELNIYLTDKAIKYDGKLYISEVKNEQGKNGKAKSKTNRASRRGDQESKSI